MRIDLTEVDESKGEPFVQFRSEYGTASANWMGARPAVNRQYDVELDCEETLIENSTFKPADLPKPQIWMVGQKVHITAIVEEAYEETLTGTLRLGDSMILVDYEGVFPASGTWIELIIEDFRLNNIDA